MESDRLNGSVISSLLKKPGMTYEGLAVEIGVSPVTVRQMENGYMPRRNREEILVHLAQLVGCSVGALMISTKAKRTA